jgi:hypothetical protein
MVFPTSVSPVMIFECSPEELKKFMKEHQQSEPIMDPNVLIIDPKAFLELLLEGRQTSGPMVDLFAQYLRNKYEDHRRPSTIYVACKFDFYIVFDYGELVLRRWIREEANKSSWTEEEVLIAVAAHEVRHKVQNRILALPIKIREAEMGTFESSAVKIWRQSHDLRRIAEAIR